jgi:hypothetical protein
MIESSVPPPMLSLLFRSKARLERELAVERCRREIADRDVLALKARLQDIETAHRNLIDQVLARQGTITAPLHPRPASERQPASPFAAAFSALSRDTLTTAPSSQATDMPS